MSDEEQLEEAVFEVPDDCQAIDAADRAFRLVQEIDDKMCDKKTAQMIERIKDNALFIIDKALQFLREPYD